MHLDSREESETSQRQKLQQTFQRVQQSIVAAIPVRVGHQQPNWGLLFEYLGNLFSGSAQEARNVEG